MTELPACQISRFPVQPVRGLVHIVVTGGGELPTCNLLERRDGRAVREVLDRVYLAFAAARLADDFTGCRHCFTESDIEYVKHVPLAALTHDDLALIGTKLISTLGGPEDVAYFIPRLLEALAQGMAVDVEPIVDRFAQLPAPAWTVERVAALRDAFEVLFESGHSDYAAGGAYGTFADPESRTYVRAKLAELPSEPNGRADA